MDDHARRVMARVLTVLDACCSGTATVADAQVAVSAAAGALDNANAPLRQALERLNADFDEILFLVPEAEEGARVASIAADLRAAIAREERRTGPAE